MLRRARVERAVVVSVVMLFVGTAAWAAPGVEELLAGAKVSLAEACREASRQRAATVTSIELTDGEDDEPVYEIEMVDERELYELVVDAATGRVLSEERSEAGSGEKTLASMMRASGIFACELIDRASRDAAGATPHRIDISRRKDEIRARVRMIRGGEKLTIEIQETAYPAPIAQSPSATPREDEPAVVDADEDVRPAPEPEPDPARREPARRPQPTPQPAPEASSKRPIEQRPERVAPEAPRAIGPVAYGVIRDFDRDELNKPPIGWSFTAQTPPWRVERESAARSGSNVLVHTGGAGLDGPVPGLTTTSPFGDIVASVAMRSVSARGEGGGGLIWRARDARNFYACLLDTERGAFTLLRVRDGDATELATAEARGSRDRWHIVQIRMVGDEISGFVDGREVLRATDAELSEPGSVGLWAPPGAVTQFDDLAFSLP